MSLQDYHLIQLLQQQSQQRQQEVALQGFDSEVPWQQVKWQQFEQQSDRLAQVLIHFGIDVQDKCAILSGNKPQWTCADVAALKARSVIVPIYPTTTLDQAAYIIQDSQAKLIFVDNQQQYQLACQLQQQCDSLLHIVVFDPQVELMAENHYHLDVLLQSDSALALDCAEELNLRLEAKNLDDLFTLIYTSGTTGTPKGVMLDYRNMASSIRQHDKELPFNPSDVSLAFLPLSHIFERAWSFYVLCRGGKNVYLTDTNNVKQVMADVQPHTMCVVPRFLEKVYSAIQMKVSKGSAVQRNLFAWALKVGTAQFEVQQGRAQSSPWQAIQFALANKIVFSKLQQALGGRLKFMPCGGAALDKDVAGFFHAINVPILCGYGMTETTATVTFNTINNRVTGSNGQAMSETQIKLGQDNEILVKGDTVMRGYYNRPQDTEEAFESGWLKTGDAGYLDENGNLFITDRIKELMKTSNGKYIAPQRVEGKVGCCPMIEQVAIIADAKNYVTALIVPAFETLEAWAKEKEIHFESSLELLRHSHVMELFEARLKELQQELAGFEKIKKFTLLPEAFSIEQGLITPTLKLRRKMIYAHYHNEIAAMYSN